jgi:hypothetical protein
VLDRLELADRPAELLAVLGVFDRGVEAPPRASGRLGAQGDEGQFAHSGRVDATQDARIGDGDVVEHHFRDPPGEIEAGHAADLDAGRAGVENAPMRRVRAGGVAVVVVAGGDEHHSGHPGCEHRPDRAVQDDAAVVGRRRCRFPRPGEA